MLALALVLMLVFVPATLAWLAATVLACCLDAAASWLLLLLLLLLLLPSPVCVWHEPLLPAMEAVEVACGVRPSWTCPPLADPRMPVFVLVLLVLMPAPLSPLLLLSTLLVLLPLVLWSVPLCSNCCCCCCLLSLSRVLLLLVSLPSRLPLP